VLNILKEAEQHPTKLWYFMDGDGSSGLNKGSSGSNESTAVSNESTSGSNESKALANRETASAPKGEDGKPKLVSMVGGGWVLTYNESGKPFDLTVGSPGDRGDFEQWIVEYGDKPNTIALKCAANGKYLTAEGKDYGKTFLRDEKEWWNVIHDKDRVRPPGAYLLSLVSAPKAFLHAQQAGTVTPGTSGAKAYMREWMVSDILHLHESRTLC
jgi:hypothetical protein